tara:strand:+ start:3779 stop:4129 length:351 start_codon:yes stop_codon:yes gene_type:complete
MKITKNKLKQIIREELVTAISENQRPNTTPATRDVHKKLAQAYAQLQSLQKAAIAAQKKENYWLEVFNEVGDNAMGDFYRAADANKEAQDKLTGARSRYIDLRKQIDELTKQTQGE